MPAADLSAEVEALKKDLGALRNDIRSLNDAVANELQARLARAGDGVSAAARETLSSVSRAGERGYNTALQQIEQHPITSVLLAAGIGLLIGSMLRR